MKALVLVLLSGLFLSACGGEYPEADSRNLQPADKELAALYNGTCRSCHTIATTGAPLTGDVEAWEPRMAMGLDVMVESVVSGSGGMPPFGLCMHCDAEQFEQLILFMANGK